MATNLPRFLTPHFPHPALNRTQAPAVSSPQISRPPAAVSRSPGFQTAGWSSATPSGLSRPVARPRLRSPSFPHSLNHPGSQTPALPAFMAVPLRAARHIPCVTHLSRVPSRTAPSAGPTPGIGQNTPGEFAPPTHAELAIPRTPVTGQTETSTGHAPWGPTGRTELPPAAPETVREGPSVVRGEVGRGPQSLPPKKR